MLTSRYKSIACTGALCALLLSGCALSYIDSDGNRRVIGLADVEVVPSSSSETFAGHIVSIHSLGMSWSEVVDGSVFNLGYSRQIFGHLQSCDTNSFPSCGREADSTIKDIKAGPLWIGSLPDDRESSTDFNVVGFLDFTITAPSEASSAGVVVHLEAAGISVTNLGSESVVSLGYAETTTAAIKPSVYVRGHPLGIAETLEAGKGAEFH